MSGHLPECLTPMEEHFYRCGWTDALAAARKAAISALTDDDGFVRQSELDDVLEYIDALRERNEHETVLRQVEERQEHWPAGVEVEEAQGQAYQRRQVMVRVTFDEYTEILREVLKDYGNEPGHLWHPEDLLNTIETINQAILALTNVVNERVLNERYKKISDLSEPQAGEFFK